MAPVKSLTTELELRSDERGKWSVWFKGERIPGIVKINGDWEAGTRAEITLTFIGAAVALVSDLPSGVFYRAEHDTLVDEGGNVLETALRWYARRDEFPPYVPKIPDGVFYVPELMMFFRTSNFGAMSPEFNAEWFERRDEFPQKRLTDAVDETWSIQSPDKKMTITDREITIIP